MNEEETARRLGELLDADPEETEIMKEIIRQNGIRVFFERLEDWKLPAELAEKLQALRLIVWGMEQVHHFPSPEGRNSDGPVL